MNCLKLILALLLAGVAGGALGHKYGGYGIPIALVLGIVLGNWATK